MGFPGGKNRCFQKIINLMPPHSTYIESHLGSGAVLRNKAPAQRSFGIDLDPDALARFSGFPSNFSFIHGRAEDFLLSFPFEGNELLYCDPPYVPSSRKQKKVYRADYTLEDHEVLLEILTQLRCPIIISGYPSSLYSTKLSGWNQISFAGISHSGRRTECLWLNYIPLQIHDLRYLGWNFRERQAIKRKRNRWVSRFLSEQPHIQQALLEDMCEAYNQNKFHKLQGIGRAAAADLKLPQRPSRCASI